MGNAGDSGTVIRHLPAETGKIHRGSGLVMEEENPKSQISISLRWEIELRLPSSWPSVQWLNSEQLDTVMRKEPSKDHQGRSLLISFLSFLLQYMFFPAEVAHSQP